MKCDGKSKQKETTGEMARRQHKIVCNYCKGTMSGSLLPHETAAMMVCVFVFASKSARSKA